MFTWKNPTKLHSSKCITVPKKQVLYCYFFFLALCLRLSRGLRCYYFFHNSSMYFIWILMPRSHFFKILFFLYRLGTFPHFFIHLPFCFFLKDFLPFLFPCSTFRRRFFSFPCTSIRATPVVFSYYSHFRLQRIIFCLFFQLTLLSSYFLSPGFFNWFTNTSPYFNKLQKKKKPLKYIYIFFFVLIYSYFLLSVNLMFLTT